MYGGKDATASNYSMGNGGAHSLPASSNNGEGEERENRELRDSAGQRKRDSNRANSQRKWSLTGFSDSDFDSADESVRNARHLGDIDDEPNDFLPNTPSKTQSSKAQLKSQSKRAFALETSITQKRSTQILLFVGLNALFQLTYFGVMMPKFSAIAQKRLLHPSDIVSPILYLFDALCLVAGVNGFLLWLHFVALAYLRSTAASLADGSLPSSLSSSAHSSSQRTRPFHLIKQLGCAILASMPLHITVIVVIETAWTIFTLIDGLLLTRFGLHIISPPVFNMLGHPEWFAAMAHLDLKKCALMAGGIILSLSIQSAVFYVCGRFARPNWLMEFYTQISSLSLTKISYTIPTLFFTFSLLWILAVPTSLTYGDASGGTLPIHFPTIITGFTKSDNPHRQKLLPFVDAVPLVNSSTTIMDKSLYPTLRNKKNILIIMGDSLRFEWMYREESRRVREWLDIKHPNYTCHTYSSHFSGGHSTEMGVFSTMYSMWPEIIGVRKAEAVLSAASFPLSTLKANGYKLYGFKAGTLSYSYILRAKSPTFFAVNQLHQQNDFPDHTDAQVVEELGKWKQQWDNTHSADSTEHYFVLLFLSSAHGLAVTHREAQLYWEAVDTYDANFRDTLKLFQNDINMGKTNVIITSDHAELVGDDGLYGHGWNSLDMSWRQELVGIPLSMCLPNERVDSELVDASGKASRELTPWGTTRSWADRKIYRTGEAAADQPLAVRFNVPTSQVDVFPTLLEYMGMDPPLPPRLYSHGKSIFSLDLATENYRTPLLNAFELDPADKWAQCMVDNDQHVAAFDNLNGQDQVAIITKDTIAATYYNLDDCLFLSKANDEGECVSKTITSVFNTSTSQLIKSEAVHSTLFSRLSLECTRARLFWMISHPLVQLPHAAPIRRNAREAHFTVQKGLEAGRAYYQGTRPWSGGECATFVGTSTSPLPSHIGDSGVTDTDAPELLTSTSSSTATLAASSSSQASPSSSSGAAQARTKLRIVQFRPCSDRKPQASQMWVPTIDGLYRNVAMPNCTILLREEEARADTIACR